MPVIILLLCAMPILDDLFQMEEHFGATFKNSSEASENSEIDRYVPSWFVAD